MTKVQKTVNNPVSTKLQQASMLWCAGDWAELAELADNNSLMVDSELACYSVAALFQCGKAEQAKALIEETKLKQVAPKLLAKVLVSGVLNNLAKAQASCFQHDKADVFFEEALNTGLDFPASNALRDARATTQLAQMGVPKVANNTATEYAGDFAHFLKSAGHYFPGNAALQLALAEHYQHQEHYDKAIVHWQQVSALLDKDTPQPYYDRLKDAYKAVKSFPQASVEQEQLLGDTDKHKLLADIHDKLKPEFYFEIGVQTGKSLALAKCEAIGVDPMPFLSVDLHSEAKVITASSDAFFAQKSDMLLTKSIDLAFIDGMHLFEYALRDFINTERYAKPHSVIVIDDIFPGHQDQAKRDRCTRAWTGDVWKVKAILQQYRPDLVVLAIDAYPTGLLMITGLNPHNTELQDNYEQIVQRYLPIEHVPEDIMQRSDAVSGKDNKISELIALVREAKQQPADANSISEKWSSN